MPGSKFVMMPAFHPGGEHAERSRATAIWPRAPRVSPRGLEAVWRWCLGSHGHGDTTGIPRRDSRGASVSLDQLLDPGRGEHGCQIMGDFGTTERLRTERRGVRVVWKPLAEWRRGPADTAGERPPEYGGPLRDRAIRSKTGLLIRCSLSTGRSRAVSDVENPAIPPGRVRNLILGHIKLRRRKARRRCFGQGIPLRGPRLDKPGQQQDDSDPGARHTLSGTGRYVGRKTTWVSRGRPARRAGGDTEPPCRPVSRRETEGTIDARRRYEE